MIIIKGAGAFIGSNMISELLEAHILLLITGAKSSIGEVLPKVLCS
jgi:hypothetical protein